MKRMNVMIDEEVLEEARKASGKKTYSETINHALKEISRVSDLRAGLKWMVENHDDLWLPGYQEDYRPDRTPDEIGKKPYRRLPDPKAAKARKRK